MDRTKLSKLRQAGWEVGDAYNFLDLSDSEIELLNSLERARALVKSREQFGVEGIHNFVSDIDGDWLENWD